MEASFLNFSTFSASQFGLETCQNIFIQAEKNVKMLTERQALFKQAALEAKKAGNMEEAKEYLRQFKGFDRLIESAKGGRPVDFNTLPVPPQQIRGELLEVYLSQAACGISKVLKLLTNDRACFLFHVGLTFSSLLCLHFPPFFGEALLCRSFDFWWQVSTL